MSSTHSAALECIWCLNLDRRWWQFYRSWERTCQVVNLVVGVRKDAFKTHRDKTGYRSKRRRELWSLHWVFVHCWTMLKCCWGTLVVCSVPSLIELVPSTYHAKHPFYQPPGSDIRCAIKYCPWTLSVVAVILHLDSLWRQHHRTVVYARLRCLNFFRGSTLQYVMKNIQCGGSIHQVSMWLSSSSVPCPPHSCRNLRCVPTNKRNCFSFQ